MRAYLNFNISTVFFLLLFFPFWNILPGPRVQPIAVFAAIILLIHSKRIQFPALIILIITSIWIGLSFVIHGNKNITDQLISITVLMVPLLIFASISKIREVRKVIILKRLTLALACIAIIQSFEVLDFIFEPIRLFIPIGKSSSLLSYRGVSLLSPEPSNAAFIIATLLWFWRLQNEKPQLLYLLALIILVITNRSGTMLLLLFPYIVTRINIKKGAYYLFVLFFLYNFLGKVEIRFIDIIENLVHIITSGLWRNTEYWYLISGPRFVEVYIAYLEALRNPFGLGIGSIEMEYTEIIRNSGVSMGNYWDGMVEKNFFNNSRPNSYLSYLALTLGIIPAIIVLINASIIVLKAEKSLQVFGLWAIILLLFRGTITMPYPWIILGSIIIKNDLYSNNTRLN